MTDTTRRVGGSRPVAPAVLSPPPSADEAPVVGSLDELTALQHLQHDLFLRFSRGPAEDRAAGSWDHESGYLLPGLPTLPLRPEPWWPTSTRYWMARQLTHHGYLLSGDHGNRGWLLTGTVVGQGAWGEPLLSRWHPLAWITRDLVTEADAVYSRWRTRARH